MTTGDPALGRSTGVSPGTVLVTGVSRHLGARVAARLAADKRIDRVIGVDRCEPSVELAHPDARFMFVATDLTTPDISEIITRYRVDTVVHIAVAPRHGTARPASSDHATGAGRAVTGRAITGRAVTQQPATEQRAVAKEQNVIGTMQLLAACQQESGVRKVVIRSSTAAYGASFRDPAVFTEDTEPGERPRGGFARDVLDIEGYVRGFCRRRPDVVATVLRFAPFLGQGANTRLARYFALPVVPTVFGRDPRLQFIHVDDALEIVHRSVQADHPGTFNAAGAGVITLSQAVRRSGRVPLPLPEPGLSLIAGLSRGDFSLDQLDLFVHGRVVDTGPLIREFAFTPRTTAEAFDDFLRGVGAGPVSRDAVRGAERAVREGIRQARAGGGQR